MIQAAPSAVTLPNPFLGPRSRPLVVGHRGVQDRFPENTLAGFRWAVALGLDAIELDVRLTRDGRAVVFHDRTAARMTGDRRAIADLTWDEVAKLRTRRSVEVDGGVWRANTFVRYEREERIPLLAEVLAEIGHAVAINIDLKPCWSRRDELLHAVAEEVTAARVEDRVLATSFDPVLLRDLGCIAPRIALGLCWSLFSRLARGTDFRTRGFAAVATDHSAITVDLVRAMRRRGVAIGAHVVFPIEAPTATPVARVRDLLGLGLDWIESDHPEQLQRMLARA